MFSRQRLRGGVAILAAAVLTFASAGQASAAPPEPGGTTLTGDRGALSAPGTALGKNYRASSDVLAYGVGDTDGFHIMLAREKDAYAWKTLATLGTGLTDLGSFIGYTCTTGSGKYVVAVYAPAMAQNKPDLLEAGGIAAVVDVATGRVRQVASNVQLAYFNPACGPTDRVLLTRAVGANEEQTDLLAVDAATAHVVSTRRVKAQLTTPAAATGADYGVVGGKLVKVDAAGATQVVAVPDGRPYAVRATKGGIVDVLSAKKDKAVAQRFHGAKVTDLGSGPLAELQLAGLGGGRNALVGTVSGLHAAGQSDLTTIASQGTTQAVSTDGHLVLNGAITRQAATSVHDKGAPADPTLAGQMRVEMHVVHSRQSVSGVVATPAAPSGATSTGLGEPAPVQTVNRAAAPADVPSDERFPKCAVPRNAINRQVFQPSPNQVEWAVDQAVHGELNIKRPADYLKTGEPAYVPQDMFPIPAVAWGEVPAQLMLAILAQETNLAQASWHAVPGDSGNPLVADYYGNGNAALEYIGYADADCGYGIGQVTDGMTVADTGLERTAAQQVAIATDYAANIAASLQILLDKWGQLAADDTFVNDNDPTKIENWFLVAWGYNSGVYPRSSPQYGVGWLNNPANPAYPANREPFLRGSLDDASHPADWPYEEKVMGWAETPQWQWLDGAPLPLQKYSPPVYGSTRTDAQQLTLPYDTEGNYMAFCDGAGQACNSANTANPCPNTDSTCWWHGNVGWAYCPDDCATEHLTYSLGSSEPSTTRIYPKVCDVLKAPSGRSLAVVDDLTDQSDNLLGCDGGTQGGKFVLRTGSPTGDLPTVDYEDNSVSYAYRYAYYAQIDLHQVGVGYQGHMWFTHSYPSSLANYHKVVGQWTPDLPSGTAKYDVLVHLPSHGGAVTNADYILYGSAGAQTTSGECVLSQDTNGVDKWAYLGTWSLQPGARVLLSNIISGSNGSTDISFDALAFMSASGTTTHSCGSTYTS